jgi:hypothetical protein
MYCFIGHKNWSRRIPFPSDEEMSDLEGTENDKDVTVLRPTLFFCASQKTKLSRIKAHFTDYAIMKLVYDKFIEIHG